MVEEKVFDPNTVGSDLLGARIGIIIAMLFAGSFVFLPFTKRCQTPKGYANRNSGLNKFFAFSACFAAGMLMSISLLHILPEANEMYEKVVAEWEEAEEASMLKNVKLEGEEDHEGEEHMGEDTTL